MANKRFTILTVLFTFFIIFFSGEIFAQGCVDASSDEGVSIAGYLQPQYEYQFTEDGDVNSFTFNRARIGFLGSIPYDISYYAFVDFSRFKKDNFLLDGFISYNRFSFAKISFGQFKSPFSLEQNTGCAALHTVYRSKVVNELAGPQRDIGIMVSGGSDTTLIKYSVALMNDYDRGFKDENNAKSIKGRIVFSPLDFLNVGGSFAYGKTGVEEDNEKFRYGGELQLKYSNFLLQGEYLYGEDTGDYTTGGGCDGTPIEFHTGGVKRSGYFVHAMYMTPWMLQPVVKYENYDANISESNDAVDIMTFGINYFLNDWTRIQINYQYPMEQGNDIVNNMLVIQVQAKF